MSQEEVRQLVDYLAAQTLIGRTIVTWNGMGSDWPVLAEESDLPTTCRELALQHVDMMYHLFCVKGSPSASTPPPKAWTSGTRPKASPESTHPSSGRKDSTSR